MNPATKIRERDGAPLKLRIHYGPPGNKQREQTATIAQQQLKNVGIDLEIIPEDFNAFIDRTSKTHDFDLTVAGWGSGIDPHASRNLWVSDGGQNETGFKNPDVDQLYDQAIRVYDQPERKKFYSQIQKLIAEEQPYVFLWENESLYDINNRIVLPYAAGETKTSPIVDPWRWYSKTDRASHRWPHPSRPRGGRRGTPPGAAHGRAIMTRFLVRRALQNVLLLVVMSVITFGLLHRAEQPVCDRR